jgi:sodium-coupled neutral amino acid transporter 11
MALFPAIAMMVVMGATSAYTFSSVGKICAEHNVSTFKEAWSKSVGPRSAWVVSLASLSMCFGGTLVASIIIGDSFSALARTFQFPSIFTHRNNVILAMTGAVLLPMCSMKSMNALAPFSILGHIGVLYTALVMFIRHVDGTYAPGGVFFESLAQSARPSFDLKNLPLINLRAFVLLSMLSTSYVCHYNAPKFYAELKDASPSRFNRAVYSAFLGSTVTYAFMMATGYLTFGGAAQVRACVHACMCGWVCVCSLYVYIYVYV